MTRTDVLFFITLLTSSISIITIVGGMTSSVFKRLVMIQRKLNALKGLILIVVTYIDTIATYLIKNHGMGDRASLRELIGTFIEEFNKSEDEY